MLLPQLGKMNLREKVFCENEETAKSTRWLQILLFQGSELASE
jgi:hypothetical protein